MLLLALLALLQSPAPLKTVARGPTSGVEMPRQVVVRTDGAWATLWRDHAPGSAPPVIDFSRDMVVGVFLGSRPTGGYGIEIVRTVPTAGGFRVEYVETAPARDAITAQVVTAPFHLVVVPRSAGDAQFQKIDR